MRERHPTPSKPPEKRGSPRAHEAVDPHRIPEAIDPHRLPILPATALEGVAAVLHRADVVEKRPDPSPRGGRLAPDHKRHSRKNPTLGLRELERALGRFLAEWSVREMAPKDAFPVDLWRAGVVNLNERLPIGGGAPRPVDLSRMRWHGVVYFGPGCDALGGCLDGLGRPLLHWLRHDPADVSRVVIRHPRDGCARSAADDAREEACAHLRRPK
jgi:hypothetical protein